MSDLISRKAAIEAIDDLHEMPNAWLDYAVDAVMALPSAQPERKKGRWIRLYYNRPRSYTRICSECRETCWFCGIGDYNYCPWCGARMGGEQK